MHWNRGAWRLGSLVVLAGLGLGCKDEVSASDEVGTVTVGEGGSSDSGDSGSGTSGSASETDLSESETGPAECSCAPGTDLIYVVSKFGELWSFDPLSESFASVGEVGCGSGKVFSMAVDHQGQAWLLDLDTRDLLTVDLANPAFCTEPPWVPGNGGFQYFGMSFVVDDSVSLCEKLYMFRYSGDGAFSEGPGIGSLGTYDPAQGSLTIVAPTDYDGGELDGTGEGRLFAFAGVDPAKLIEYDKTTGAVISVLPLDGLSQTTASAFAFHSGDLWFFTESEPPECAPCLAACTDTYATCLVDPICAEALDCMLTTGELTDACGGFAPMELQDCVTNTCLDECFPIGGKLSEIHRLDWDESEGAGKTLTKLDMLAPIRVVGAGVSVCAPFEVP